MLVLVLTCLIDVTKSNLEKFSINNYSIELNITTTTTTATTNNNNKSKENKLESFIFMCIVYTLSTLCAIVTNLIVILVYLFGNTAKTDLSLFLVNLAVADFFM
jgi:hypothetical protein